MVHFKYWNFPGFSDNPPKTPKTTSKPYLPTYVRKRNFVLQYYRVCVVQQEEHTCSYRQRCPQPGQLGQARVLIPSSALTMEVGGARSSLEPLCRRRADAGLEKCGHTHKPQKAKNKDEKVETEKTASLRPTSPKPQKTTAQGRSEHAEKAGREAPAAKTHRKF